MTLRDLVESVCRTVVEFFQDRWFDLSRNVRTSGNISLRQAGLAAEEFPDSEWYMPARPAHIRKALRDASIKDVSNFSYVDLGSGKGRTLLIAAELPFRRVIGVELSRTLHQEACANIGRFRFWKQRCTAIESLQADAKDFIFPQDDLLVYLFNPFGRDTMARVLGNLQASLALHPRRLVVVLLWPRCGDLVAAMEGMRMHCATRQYQIFELQS